MDIAVVVNLRARKGSEAVASTCREELPCARVHVSRSLDDALRFTRTLSDDPPELLVSAGGDGTAMGLINALRGSPVGPARVLPASVGPLAARGRRDPPALGVLPLGTGNGWARATGAPRWTSALRKLKHVSYRAGRPPVRRFDLVEVFGTMAHFAGTGWDAEIIDDFHAQREGLGVLPPSRRDGLAGYLHGMFTRTIPRNVMQREQVEVELTNTGEDALTVDDEGRAVPLRGGEHGKLLYRGPASVCGAGTAPEWGFGFRAFPFAGLVPRRFCMRIYAGTAVEATMRMGPLWRGVHPLTKMHTWLTTSCRAVFSRPVPFQVGGDRLGHKTEVDYTLAPEQVDVLDWRALAAA